MAIDLAKVVKTLQRERADLFGELSKLDKAIASLRQLSSVNSASALTSRAPRLSAAARKRISKAQRARWAKFKKEQKTKA